MVMKHISMEELDGWFQEKASLDFSSISPPFVKSISQLPAVDQARLASLSILNQFGIHQAKELLGVPERTLQDWIASYLPDVFSAQTGEDQRSLYRWNAKWLAVFSRLLSQNYSGLMEQLYRRAEPWLSQTDCCSGGVDYLIQESSKRWAQRTLGAICRNWLAQHDASAIIALVESLPADVYRSSPNLLLSYIWALLIQRRLDQAVELLAVAKRLPLNPYFDPDKPFHYLQNSIQVLDYLVEFHRRPRSSSASRIRLLEKALDIPSEFQGAVLTTYASILHSAGMVDMSKQAILKAIDYHERSANPVQLSQVKSLYWQCDFNQGNCERALTESEAYLYGLQQQFDRATQQTERHVLSLAIALTHANIGHFYYDLNQIERAQRSFQAALPELEDSDLQYSVIATKIGAIRCSTSLRKLETSEALLDAVVSQSNWRHGSWLNAVVCFEKMRICRFRGESVKPIADEYQLLSKSLGVETLFMDEYEKAHLFWIKCKLMVLLEAEQFAEANILALKGLIKSIGVEDLRFQMGFSAAKALCEFKLGDMAEAKASMNRALLMMQNHLIRRSFLDDDFGWSELWDEMDSNNEFSAVLHPSLLSSVREDLLRIERASPLPSMGNHDHEAWLQRCKAVGLTEKECEIIRLLAEGLCNKKIASRSDIALTTVKWHLQNIFGKLQVKNRTEAVMKAQELGVLEG